MSDDEEIIYKGKNLGLYNYLSDLGYSDFETFEPENLSKRKQFHMHNDFSPDKYKERLNNSVSSKHSTLQITDHEYRKLETILCSQLLFKEDAYIVESLLHNKHVCYQRPNYAFHVSAVLTGLLSSVLMLRSKVDLGLGLVQWLVPAGFTVMFSCYTAWQFYKEFDENRKDYILMSHINDLKKLCFSILKLTRFIKETEILSTGQAPVNNFGPFLYLPSCKSKLVNDIGMSHQWKTLPHLRNCLSNTVEEVLNMLTDTVSSLRQNVFDREPIENHLMYLNMPKSSFKPYESSEKECCFISLLDLTELTSKYLSVQSEYLKELAFTFSSILLNETITYKTSEKFNRNKVFQICMSLRKKLTDSSFKLLMQYNIHNIASTFKKVSYKSSSSSQVREISQLQNDLHNVFLLLYSALLRVRNLEDTLENVSEVSESVKLKDKLPLSLDVMEQLTIVKDDLISTVRCYDVLCQQITSKRKNKIETFDQDEKDDSNLVEVNIKETGIVVGTSDFTVNSPDEVFLSLSGTMNCDGTSNSEFVDDWCLEMKPKIPKSLLTELSQTLKSRKTDFIEREKHALKKKGLQDIDNLSPSNDEDSDETEDSFPKEENRSELNIKYKRHITAQDFSHSSDSDDEMDPFESGSFLTKLKISKKYQSEPYSDSDSSVVDDVYNSKIICENEVSHVKPTVSTSSLANLAALRSQMWGTNKEECYSDGSES